MKEVTDQEMKDIELKILKYIKKVCDENHLRYYLAYGTLIGAIRHKGFIPWDDDIDIMMPREDYLKLIDIINNKENDTSFRMVCIDSNSDFTAPLAKVIDTRTKLVQHYGYREKVELGVYVDVFILDGVPGNYESGKKFYDEAYKIYNKWTKANLMWFPPKINRIKGILLGLINLPYKVKGYKYWLDLFEKHNSQYSFYSSEYVSVLEAGTKEAAKNVWPRKYFGEKGKASFEGEEFSAPENYDYILQSEYGDYMKLPPKEMQVSHHQYNVYWKE